MPEISIVAPVYGVEPYIKQFLESIANQTFRNFEVILVDDGSPDGCPGILDEFASVNDCCRVIHQENAGVAVARNIGLAAATGEYVYVVDSDDWLEPTALESMWRVAELNRADVIYGDWVCESQSKFEIRRCFPKEFFTKDPDTISALQYAVNSNNNKVLIQRPEFEYIGHLGGAPWRGMVKLSIIRENDLEFDPYVRGLGDDILYALHLYEHISSVAYVPEVIYHYRYVEMSYSHGYKANYFDSLDRIFEKQEAFLRQYDKGEFSWQAYYMRIVIYLQLSLGRYFMNEKNPKSDRDQFVDFVAITRTEPFATAIAKAPVALMGARGIKLFTLALRYGFVRPYWILKKLKVGWSARR